MDVTIVYRLCCIAIIFWILFAICMNHYIYVVLLLILKITFVYLEQKYKEWLPVDKRNVLITGCDTGFGQHLANRLADSGFNVFATVWKLNGTGAEKLRRRKRHNLHVIQMDVTNNDEIHAAVTYVNHKTKGTGLWGVINNAGFNIYGDLEIVSLDNYKAVMDVNLYGMISVIKAFLPQIRKSKGRIVNVSSVMGRLGMPSDSTYQISKHGVETMSDCLRLEMLKFNVGVSIIEPGMFDGATSCKSPEMLQRIKADCENMWSKASEEVKAVYGQDYFYLMYENMKKDGVSGTSSTPDPVLDAIEDALLNIRPKARYVVDGVRFDKFAIMARVSSLLPEFVTDLLWKWYTRCYNSPRDQSSI